MHHLCFVVSLVDRIVQEQCCVTVLEDNMCTTGINVAKDQGACDTLLASTCETKTTKVCMVVQYVHVHVCVFAHAGLNRCTQRKGRREDERVCAKNLPLLNQYVSIQWTASLGEDD